MVWGFDHYEVSAELDLASWDWYVGTGHHDYLESGARHDLTRGFKRRNFWLMETQPGTVNWAKVNSSIDKCEARAMAWHAIAHGADAVLYWQWRSALGGQEQYHGTLVDQSGQPRPFYVEARELAEEVNALSDLLAGSAPRARVAILHSYDSRWSVEFQRHHADFDYIGHLLHHYRPLAAANVAVDIISADAPLDGYQLVIAPALVTLPEQRAANLLEFVRRGGHLVLTVRTGMKDANNALLSCRQPGPLREAAGVEVEDFYALDEPAPLEGPLLTGTSQLWAERLHIADEKRSVVMARWGKSNGWLDGQVAMAVHPFGSGMVYTVGAYLDDAAQQTFTRHVLKMAGVRPFDAPAGVEVARRVREDGREIYLVINHTPEPRALSLPWPAFDHLAERAARDLELGPYGVAVLSQRDKQEA